MTAPLVGAREQVERALRLALEVARPQSATEVVARLLEQATAETGAERAAMARLVGQRLVVDATRGVPAAVDFTGRVLDPAESSLLSLALTEGRPAAGRLAAAGPDDPLGALAEEGGQAAVIPLMLDGAAHGVLLLGRRDAAPFAERDLTILELLSSHATLALHNAHSSDRLRLGVEMAMALATRLEPVAVIRDLLEMTMRVMGGRATLSRVLDERELVVVDSFSEELPAFPVNTRWQLADYPLMSAAIKSGLPQTGEENRDPRYFPPEIEIVAVPLNLGTRPFAVLGLSRRHLPFSPEDKLTLQLVGTVAALALRNADLFHELREASRTKTQFMNLVAHELRGPLSVISAYLSLLETGGAPDPGAAGVLMAKVEESNDLIDALLLAARLEGGGRVASKLEVLEMGELARRAVERLRPRADLAGALLDIQLPERGVPVVTDRDQVGRILDNLLNNALIYGGEPARIRVAIESHEDGVEVTVADSGRGIPAERWEEVFQQFTRLDELPGSSGTGIGLFISRGLAEGLGGRLDIAESRMGSGTTFRLRLPAGPPPLATD